MELGELETQHPGKRPHDSVSVLEVKNCLVCNDTASGLHYSAVTCEGCKGFFKRTIQKNLQYTCRSQTGVCEITKHERNNCQCCRFQKCLIVGMKVDAVRKDRTPGGKSKLKKQKLETESQVIEIPDENELQVTYMSPPSSSSGSSNTLQRNNTSLPSFELDSTKWKEVIQNLIDTKPEAMPWSDDVDTLDNMTIGKLMQYGFQELTMIIKWAKNVPFFKMLSLDDRIAVLKSSFMDLNVLRLSYRSMKHPDQKLHFASTIALTADEATAIGWSEDLISSNLSYIKQLHDMDLDFTSFCVMNALMLLYPDATGLKQKQLVTSIQSHFLECLRLYFCEHYPNGASRYGKFLLKLPALRNIGAKAMESFLALRLDGKVELNKLVAEMMDMPL